MRVRTLALPGIAALGAIALLAACVSLDGVATGSGADAAEVGADAADDGSDDAEVPQSTPGVVTCGPLQCTLPATQCCIAAPSTPGGPIDTKCQLAGQTCSTYVVTCDEKADCQNGEYCCIGFGDAGDRHAACGRACTNALQACKTDGECVGGKTCKQQACFGVHIWVCAPNAVCSAN